MREFADVNDSSNIRSMAPSSLAAVFAPNILLSTVRKADFVEPSTTDDEDDDTTLLAPLPFV
jgi:hypothetical protein